MSVCQRHVDVCVCVCLRARARAIGGTSARLLRLDLPIHVIMLGLLCFASSCYACQNSAEVDRLRTHKDQTNYNGI